MALSPRRIELHYLREQTALDGMAFFEEQQCPEWYTQVAKWPTVELLGHTPVQQVTEVLELTVHPNWLRKRRRLPTYGDIVRIDGEPWLLADKPNADILRHKYNTVQIPPWYPELEIVRLPDFFTVNKEVVNGL